LARSYLIASHAAIALAACALAMPTPAQQPSVLTQELARQIEPAIAAYSDTLSLADQSLRYAVAMRRITPEQAAASLRDNAVRLAAFDLRGLDPSVVAEHRTAMMQLMQQVEAAIAGSNRWPQGRAPNDYKAHAQRTLQRLRADYEQKLARGLAPTATASALLVVLGWTRGEAQLAPGSDWFAGDLQRIDDAMQTVLPAARSVGGPQPPPSANMTPPIPNVPTPGPVVPPSAQIPYPSVAQAPGSVPGATAPGPLSPGIPIPNAGNLGFGPLQMGMDVYDGADYRNFPIPSADPSICLAECARDARCRAVTYTRPGTYGAAQASCWLKAQPGRFGPHASAISAVKIDVPPPAVAMPSVAGAWLFRGIQGQQASIVQMADGRLLLMTERGVRGNGHVESATTIVADFPFAQGLRGTLTPDQRRINWANGEFWTRDALAATGAPPIVTPPPLAVVPPPGLTPRPPAMTTSPTAAATSLAGRWNGPLGIYEMTHTGNSFTWRVGAEIGQGTIVGDNLQVTWTGGGSATGRITQRTPQGTPTVIGWSNGAVFRRVGY
jgi:hypothetical protein